MSVLRTIAIVLFVVGLIGLIFPVVPGAEFIKYAIGIAALLVVVELFAGRRS